MGLVDGPIQVDPLHFLTNQVRLVGSKQNHRRDLVEALDLAAAGKVKPRLEVYPLERINEVRDRLEAGKVPYPAVPKPLAAATPPPGASRPGAGAPPRRLRGLARARRHPREA